jgi:hypothetical protein
MTQTTTSSPSRNRSASDVPAESILAHAVKEDIPLTKAARSFVKEGDVRATVRRVKRWLKKRPAGKEFIDLFLRKGSRYDRMLSARLACEAGEALEMIVWARVPLSDVCEGLAEKDRIYQTLYNRIYRNSPDILPDLTGSSEDQNKTIPAFRFFNITPYELETLQ